MGKIFGDASEPVQLTAAREAEEGQILLIQGQCRAGDLEVEYPRAGTFAETKDALAYMGSAPNFPRYLFALGFGGNGITFGAIAAEIIRDQLLQRPNAAGRLFRFYR